MKLFFHICGLVLLLLVGSHCNTTNVYEEKSKSIDSLSGVLNASLRGFEGNVDSVLLEKSLLRFMYYKDFIQQNVQDTLERVEADNLRHFYNAGTQLEDFSNNRRQILSRMALLNQQLQELSKDIQEKNLHAEQLLRYSRAEAIEVKHLTDLSFAQQKIYQTHMEEFKMALSGVESLIRRRNNGELPHIVKDTIAL